MKKILIIYSVFLIFSIITVKKVNASEFINIFIDGQVSIDKQINGVSIDYNQDFIDVYDVSVDFINSENEFESKSLEKACNNDKSYRFYGTIESSSSNDQLVINGKIKSEKLNVESAFKKIYYVEEALNNSEFNSDGTNYNILISANELKNFITYDVVFKSDDGGILVEGQDNVEYINILPGEEFPKTPNIIANSDCEFIGWYDEIEKCYIEEFPKSVEKDHIITAKWKNKKEDKEVINKNDILNIKSYNPPNSVKENNIILKIVSYIICLTISVQ